MEINLTPISTARRLREQNLYYVTPSLLADLLDLGRPQAYRLLHRLENQELVSPVENGKYLLLGLESEKVLSNPLFIASQLVTPSYVSYWSALHYHGLTEQVPRVVFVATTRKKRPVEFRGHFFRYVTLQPHKFFGYDRQLGSTALCWRDG
jgi:predicted transcriptional regulator of viral defense system